MKIKNYKIENSLLMTAITAMLFVLAGTAYATTGNILPGSKAKVCHDVTCTNPPPEIIDFKISEPGLPFVVDSDNGLSGTIWGGNSLGWITMNPSTGGVYFTDVKTGLLTGNASSEKSGIINFGVTGQKVIIDPKTGEWNGYAWASGEYGGWIKFDCADPYACVRTPWNKVKERVVTKVEATNILANSISSGMNVVKKTSDLFTTAYNNTVFRVANTILFIEDSTTEAYNNTIPYVTNFTTSLLDQIKTIFQSLASNAINAIDTMKINRKFDALKTENKIPPKIENTGKKERKEKPEDFFLNEIKIKTSKFFRTTVK